jgi:RanBP-type and C3HC4-type zinc finger-containing protein 1
MPSRSRKKQAKRKMETQKLIDEKISLGEYMLCLGECGAIIQKDGGCNWIKCIICKTELCWQCRLIKKGNYPNVNVGFCPYGNPACNSH